MYFNTSKIRQNGYPDKYKEFLRWHSSTSSVIPNFVWLCSGVCHAVTFGCIMLVFGIHFFEDDPNEIMFPPLLEAKDINQEKKVTEEKADVEVGHNANTIYSQSFHFVRPKQIVLQSSLWGSIWGYVIITYLLHLNYPMGLSILIGIPAGLPFGSLAGMLLSGLVVQIHNATTL